MHYHDSENKIAHASCHCGTVQLSVHLPDGLTMVKRCNCSLCSKKGMLITLVGGDAVTIDKGEDNLGMYSYHTHVAKHYFCKTCGIHTHVRPRSAPDKYAINTACIPGVKVEDYTNVDFIDGRNHPLDA